MKYSSIINDILNKYLTENILLTEDQERTIRNKIARGVAAITHLDSASTEVQTMTDEVLKNYVEHPMHDNIHKRQNNEIWAINFVIDRMMPYIIREKSDGGFFVNKSPRVKNAWENLIQAQSAEHVSKMPVWNSDDNLHYWNTNKRYNDALEAAKKQASNNIEGQGNYSVYHIDGFNSRIEGLNGMTFQKLGTYTGGLGAIPLCFTNNEAMYASFTNHNKYDMYALLRDGWEKEKCVVDESTFPFDSYGLSMIFVVIGNNGQLFHSNVRWNHGPHGHDVGSKVDNIFTYSKLVEVVGSDVMRQIGANAEIDNDLFLTHEVEQKLKQGTPINDIFEYVYDDGNFCLVVYNQKRNYLDLKTNELLSDIWFDYSEEFEDNCSKVKKDGMYNFIREDGTFVWPYEDTNEWFEYVSYFDDGFAPVRKNGHWNFIRENGTFVWDTLDTNEWFDDVECFCFGCARVFKDNKENFLREEGTLVWDTLDTNEWFDSTGDFYDGFSIVRKCGKFNLLREEGTLVWDTLDANEWFDGVDDFGNGFFRVKKDEKCNFIRRNGTLVWDTLDTNEWFDYVEKVLCGFARVQKGDKVNFLRTNGTLVWPYEDTNEWFDKAWHFYGGLAQVRKDGKWKYLSKDGKLYDERPNTDNVIQECINRYLKRNLLIC